MWYLTYYEDYPIYEPAEGGYYYAGTQECGVEEFKTLHDALARVKSASEELFVEDFTTGEIDEEFWSSLATLGSTTVAGEYSKYIGESRYLVLETPATLYNRECGWHPYE